MFHFSTFQTFKVILFIDLQTPVIFTDSNLVAPAVSKWSLDYLASNLGDGSYSVYESKDHRFKYFDEKKAKVHKGFPESYETCRNEIPRLRY